MIDKAQKRFIGYGEIVNMLGGQVPSTQAILGSCRISARAQVIVAFIGAFLFGCPSCMGMLKESAVSVFVQQILMS